MQQQIDSSVVVRHGDAWRVVAIERVVAVGLAVSLLLAPGLWLERRFFTPLPIARAWHPLPRPFDLAVLLTLTLMPLGTLFMKRPRAVILVWSALFVVRTCWDRATWQPFLLMYAFLFLATAWADWTGVTPARDAAVLNVTRLVLCCVYVWSALSKLSYGFVHAVLPEMLQVARAWLPIESFVRVGWLFPLTELAIGLGLLFPRTRNAACVGAVLMHGCVLLSVGPLGNHYNMIVWPWNVAMIALVVLAFARTHALDARTILLARGTALRYPALLLFAILPGCSYIGLWPTYLSFRLYSDQYHWALISVSRSVYDKLPPASRSRLERTPADQYYASVSLAHWSEQDLGAFLPPEPSVFRDVANRICALAIDPHDVRLTILPPADRFTGRTAGVASYCDEL